MTGYIEQKLALENQSYPESWILWTNFISSKVELFQTKRVPRWVSPQQAPQYCSSWSAQKYTLWSRNLKGFLKLWLRSLKSALVLFLVEMHLKWLGFLKKVHQFLKSFLQQKTYMVSSKVSSSSPKFLFWKCAKTSAVSERDPVVKMQPKFPTFWKGSYSGNAHGLLKRFLEKLLGFWKGSCCENVLKVLSFLKGFL